VTCFLHQKHCMSSAKPPIPPSYTRTLIHAIVCLVWLLLLPYIASLSPFLFGRVFPAICVFFLMCKAPVKLDSFTFCRTEYSLLIYWYVEIYFISTWLIYSNLISVIYIQFIQIVINILFPSFIYK
jgi:hypothetical protein